LLSGAVARRLRRGRKLLGAEMLEFDDDGFYDEDLDEWNGHFEADWVEGVDEEDLYEYPNAWMDS
tara:strand:- start:1192 stop:1386 length:195 start_codon:yes stop_codon:yes gene_type:complete